MLLKKALNILDHPLFSPSMHKYCTKCTFRPTAVHQKRGAHAKYRSCWGLGSAYSTPRLWQTLCSILSAHCYLFVCSQRCDTHDNNQWKHGVTGSDTITDTDWKNSHGTSQPQSISSFSHLLNMLLLAVMSYNLHDTHRWMDSSTLHSRLYPFCQDCTLRHSPRCWSFCWERLGSYPGYSVLSAARELPANNVNIPEWYIVHIPEKSYLSSVRFLFSAM